MTKSDRACRANDPSTCAYHGNVTRLENAMTTASNAGDFAAYEKANSELQIFKNTQIAKQAFKEGLDNFESQWTWKEDGSEVSASYGYKGEDVVVYIETVYSMPREIDLGDRYLEDSEGIASAVSREDIEARSAEIARELNAEYQIGVDDYAAEREVAEERENAIIQDLANNIFKPAKSEWWASHDADASQHAAVESLVTFVYEEHPVNFFTSSLVEEYWEANQEED